ncbi:MAG: hypothetical protein ACK5MG_09705 [Bacteroidales bacterium]
MIYTYFKSNLKGYGRLLTISKNVIARIGTAKLIWMQKVFEDSNGEIKTEDLIYSISE